MKIFFTLMALAGLAFASVGCVQHRPDTVVLHEAPPKPAPTKPAPKKSTSTTTTRYITRAPSGPPTTVPGSPQQIGDPGAASDFRATSP